MSHDNFLSFLCALQGKADKTHISATDTLDAHARKLNNSRSLLTYNILKSKQNFTKKKESQSYAETPKQNKFLQFDPIDWPHKVKHLIFTIVCQNAGCRQRTGSIVGTFG